MEEDIYILNYKQDVAETVRRFFQGILESGEILPILYSNALKAASNELRKKYTIFNESVIASHIELFLEGYMEGRKDELKNVNRILDSEI